MDFVNSCRMRHADFEVVKVIGRGAFGEVQLVKIQMHLMNRIQCHNTYIQETFEIVEL